MKVIDMQRCRKGACQRNQKKKKKGKKDKIRSKVWRRKKKEGAQRIR